MEHFLKIRRLACSYVREINPGEKAMAKKQLRKLLDSSIFIKYYFYDPIDRPIRHNLGFDDVSLYFSKEFLRFCKEDLVNLYDLMRFPQVVSLENQSVMSG